MQRFYDEVTDRFGNPAAGVVVTVYDAGTTTPSALYVPSTDVLDPAGSLANPFTTASDGVVAFAVASGRYTINYSGSNVTPKTLTWVTLSDSTTGGGGAVWGAITGTLASQTDLNTALGLKAPSASPTFTTSATFSFLTNTRVPFAGAAGALTDNANFTYTVGTGLKVADATASTASTNGALIVTGGIGAGEDSYFNKRLFAGANGTTTLPLDLGASAGGSITMRLFGAAATNRLIAFLSGGTTRWFYGVDNTAETGSDAGSAFLIKARSDAPADTDNVFHALRVAGGQITIGETSRPVSLAKTANGAQWLHGSISESLTLSTAGTTTDTTANLLPANAIIEAVVARVTTTITTATSWQLGDPTTAGRFTNANSTMTAGTTDIGLKHQQGSISTDATGPVQTAAAKVRVTTVGTPGAGVIRITVFYRQFVAPTS